MSLRYWGTVGGFTRSRKCKEIDISIDVIVPLYFIYSTEGKQIYINETTEKLKHLKIIHAREMLYVMN